MATGKSHCVFLGKARSSRLRCQRIAASHHHRSQHIANIAKTLPMLPSLSPSHCQHCQNIANIAIATMHCCHHCQHCSQYAANVAITVTIITTASNIANANIITNFVILCLWAICKRRVCGISKCASVSLHLFVAYFPCQQQQWG